MGDKKGKDSRERLASKERDEIWKCKTYKKTFSDANCNVLECERCSEHFCAKCCKLNESEYTFLNSRKDIHWFCTNCNVAATESVISDKDIQAKINKYMKDFNNKISELDNKLIDKLDKKEFDIRMEKFKNKYSEIITNLKGELQELKMVFDNLHAKMNTNLIELFEKDISEFVDNKLSENTLWSKVMHEESWAELQQKLLTANLRICRQK